MLDHIIGAVISMVSGAATGAIVAYWSLRRARQQWQSKRFDEEVRFSLNFIVHMPNGELDFRWRSLLETNVATVWQNKIAAQYVLDAAAQTSDVDPLVRLRDEKAMLTVKAAVMNTITARFAEVFTAQSLGVSSCTDSYIFAITFEHHDAMDVQKIRVMLINESLLHELFANGHDPAAKIFEPGVEKKVRLKTLEKMYRELEKNPSLLANSPLGRVELGVIA